MSSEAAPVDANPFAKECEDSKERAAAVLARLKSDDYAREHGKRPPVAPPVEGRPLSWGVLGPPGDRRP